MGGPLSDHTGALLLLEGVTDARARELLAGDPFVENGVFVLDEVLDWTIFVDELTGLPNGDGPPGAGQAAGPSAA